jgi:transposase-like protein
VPPAAPESSEGVRAEGYVTVDQRWICEPCYEDFKVMFDWRLET